jgi:hypothetical protein
MKIKGVNAFGWRLRHDYFDKAISDGWMFEKVLAHLNKASFNPEFYKSHHKAVLDHYNKQKGKSLKVHKMSFIQKLIGSRA